MASASVALRLRAFAGEWRQDRRIAKRRIGEWQGALVEWLDYDEAGVDAGAIPTSKTGAFVRGAPARIAHLDPAPCPVPPDWNRQVYGSIFTRTKRRLTRAHALLC